MRGPPSSSIIAENLNPLLFAKGGEGRNSSLDGLILDINKGRGRGARRSTLNGPGDEAVLLMSASILRVRLGRCDEGDVVRLRMNGAVGALSRSIVVLFGASGSSAAMFMVFRGRKLGGIVVGEYWICLIVSALTPGICGIVATAHSQA